MTVTEERIRNFHRVASLLPPSVRAELLSLRASRRDFFTSLREVRIRAGAVSSAVIGGKELPLMTRLGQRQVEEVLDRITGESLYAYRENIAKGYLSLDGGIRVGICGSAGYERGTLVGVRGVTSLAFRFPFAGCSYGEELYREYRNMGRGNLLIVSPPSGGKTTALKALAGLVSSGDGARRVAIIDDREEFSASDYSGCLVDMIRGYERSAGVQIALRTLACGCAVMDEIAAEGDVSAVLDCFGAGVEIIATAHGEDALVLERRPVLRPLLRWGVFGAIAVLHKEGDGFGYRLFRADEISNDGIPVECTV